MKRGFVDTPDGQIHYRHEGEGEAIVVLHATPSSARGMLPLLSALAKESHAIGMDTMGYGDSDRPNPPYTTMGQFAGQVAALIKGLGLKKAAVVGVLTGSQVALQTAADHPDLVSCCVTQEAFNWDKPERRAVHERLHRYHPHKEDGSHLIEMWNRNGGGRQIDPRVREAGLMDLMRVNDDRGAEVYGGMGWEGAGPYAMCRQPMWEIAPSIQVPVLLTYNPNSELHRALEQFLRLIPNSRGLRDAPSAHQDPEGFARLVLDFVKESTGAKTPA